MITLSLHDALPIFDPSIRHVIDQALPSQFGHHPRRGGRTHLQPRGQSRVRHGLAAFLQAVDGPHVVLDRGRPTVRASTHASYDTYSSALPAIAHPARHGLRARLGAESGRLLVALLHPPLHAAVPP